MACNRCGDCCRNNGLIPPTTPLLYGGTDNWLGRLVERLRAIDEICDLAEDHACMFLTDGNCCDIYDDRPSVCREFTDCPNGHEIEADDTAEDKP